MSENWLKWFTKYIVKAIIYREKLFYSLYFVTCNILKRVRHTYICSISQYVCVYIVYVIYTDRKYEIFELENRLFLTEHLSSISPEGTGMRANCSPGHAWDSSEVLGTGQKPWHYDSKFIQGSWHIYPSLFLSRERENFTLKCNQIFSGERKGRALPWNVNKWLWGRKSLNVPGARHNLCLPAFMT